MSGITGIVCCDSCKHKIPNQTVANWHGEPCPKCGAPNIVDDFDMRCLAELQLMMDMGLARQGPTNTGLTLVMDSAALKKGQPA